MADPRNFAKIDLGYFDNPKITSLLDDHPRVPLLHLRAILYCRQHLTDGVFPIKPVVRMASADYCGSQCEPHSESQCDFCKAVNADLFALRDARNATVHDYLEHQESAKKAAERKAAGQTGAAARWGKENGANRNATGIADRIAGGNANRNAEKRREEKSSTRNARSKPSTPIPEDWEPSEAHKQYANEHTLDLSSEAFRFRNHALTNDRRVVRWDAAFSNWLSKAEPSKQQQPRNPKIPEGW